MLSSIHRTRFLRTTLLVLSIGSYAPAQPIMGDPYAQNGSITPISSDPAWWTQLGGSSSHHGSSSTPQVSGMHLSDPLWTSTGDGEIELSFTPQAGVVVDDERVYALGHDQSHEHHLAAFDLETGALVWATPIPFSLLDSWSMPALDPGNDTVIVATGFSMVALDRHTGDLLWETGFDLPMVNASPCVTDDLGPADRVLITDYSFGTSAHGSLICINIDPFDPVLNPYEPGAILWSAALPGNCSGNTPAYDNGIVYVSTSDGGLNEAGHILAFDATATTAPLPLWDTPNPQQLGFFSAVTLANDSVYASSYNFNGSQRSANTIKLNASTGDLIWSVPTVRTDACPVVLPNGQVVVSGGIPTGSASIFTGSLPAIELIDDLGDSAVVLWDSYEATHQDLNNSGTWDNNEPYLSIGGWGHHPTAITVRKKTSLLVATMNPPSGFDAFTHARSLHAVDLSRHPTDPGFIVSTRADVGNTPAIFGDRVCTTSAYGLSVLNMTRSPISAPLIERVRGVVDGHRSKRELLQAP